MAKNTKLSVRQIHQEINQKASRGVVGEIIGLVAMQQLYGHGANLMSSLMSDRPLMYTDWIVVLLIPPMLTVYIYDVLINHGYNKDEGKYEN